MHLRHTWFSNGPCIIFNIWLIAVKTRCMRISSNALPRTASVVDRSFIKKALEHLETSFYLCCQNKMIVYTNAIYLLLAFAKQVFWWSQLSMSPYFFPVTFNKLKNVVE